MAVAPHDEATGSAAASPAGEPVPAWQSFAAGPYARMFSGHMRASWPVDLPEPGWAANTFANLTLERFDGKTFTGEVSMWAAPGLDTTTCAVEVIWDTHGKQGIRLTAPPAIKLAGGAGTHATWRFRARVAASPPAVQATAFVFCPLNNAHIDRPWGVQFYTIEMIAPGPGMRAAYCKELRADRSSPGSGPRGEGIVGHDTFELMFACGALIRLRGRDVIDECRGDVLLSLDALGPGVTSGIAAAGTPLLDDELRRWHGGSGMCLDVALAARPPFGPRAAPAFAAFIKRAGRRLLGAFSRDGMIQP